MSIEGISPGIEEQAPTQSPTLTQEQVNRIIQREKSEAAERARRESQSHYEKQIADLKAQQSSMGGMPQSIDEDKLYEKFQNRMMGEMQKQQEDARMQSHQKVIADAEGTFLNKMGKGKDLFDDFEKVTANFDAREFPETAFLASYLDNTPEVMYELAQNPTKLMTIHGMAKASPRMAEAELRKISESIKANQAAKANHVKTNPPLARLQPSTAAGADTGEMTIADFKKASYLRG